MKKNLLTLLAFGAALCCEAQNFTTSDGLMYTVTSAANKTVCVAKPPTAYTMAEVKIPATVTDNGIEYAVTGIADQAFQSNANITSVTIPDGCLTIGKSAFQSCSALTYVDMGKTVTSLGDNAFFSANKVTTLRLSPTVKSIGKWGLRAMSSLVTLELGEDLERIPDGMCWGNTKIKGITIPDKVKYVGENAFASCSALDSIQLGAALDTLAAKAFAYCSQVKKLIIRAPEPPVCMDEKSLVNTYTKTALYVSEKSLELYQKTAPYSSFETILPYDPSGSLDDKTFVAAGVGYEVLSKENFQVAVAHIDTLTYAGEIVVRPTVNYAGHDFSVIAVKEGAFANSPQLTQVELPNSIATIGTSAFSQCTALKYLIMRNPLPPTLGDAVFAGVNQTSCRLFFPSAGAAAYKEAAQWKDFTNTGLVIDEVKIGNLTYKANDIISGTLDLVSAKGSKGELILPDEVTIEGYPFYITNILGNAFYSTDITAITLPKTLKTISGNAFYTLGAYNNPIDTIVVPEGVTSIGSNAFYGCHVNNVILPKKSLTHLAGSAFYACDIKGIEIPGSVGVINSSTFYGADLTWVVLGEGITEIQENAFFGSDLGSLRLPSSLRIIGEGAFSACTSLSSLTINEGLEKVASSAFSNCASLYKIFNFATTMPDGLENSLADSGSRIGAARTTYSTTSVLSSGTSFGTVIVRSNLGSWFDYNGVRYLPDLSTATTVTAVDASYNQTDKEVELASEFTLDGKKYTVNSVANYLLCGQPFMTSANITYPFTTLPAGFARKAINLKEMTLPETLTTLGEFCFAETDSLQSVKLPNGLQTIGLASFYFSGIKELTVPGSVTLMDNASVSACKRLESLTFEDGPGSILMGYYPTLMGNNPLFMGSKIKEVKIGRNLQTFSSASYGYSPFYNDTTITQVVITDMPTSVPNNLFLGCKYLKTLNIGNGVTTIGSASFSGCAALDTVKIGKSVSMISKDAFAGVTNLRKFYSLNTVPPQCSTGSLTDINKQTCTLYVPDVAIPAYKEAFMWKNFYNIEEDITSSVNNVLVENEGRYTVFNLQGVCILDTYDAEEVESLPSGIYIINGRKVAKR